MSCEINEKLCDKCEVNYPISSYRKYNETSIGKTCKKCLNELDKIRKKNLRQKRSETVFVKCEKCQEEKALKCFAKLKKFYKKKICRSCYPNFLTEQKTEWCKNEHNTNINYRIKKSLAARLRAVIVKNDSTMNYIGCNIQYLREWFEYNFTSEMNWDNYGSYWSIDHIIPVCKFELTDEDEKLKCCNWTNLMPVTVKYNSSKKSIDMEQIEYIVNKIENFKEEGSTTKWFSSEFILNKDFAEMKEKMKANMNSL
ncbi:MAG: hypothetical protein NTZ51_06350 [Proteobacteria bacterium]|jgi:hypothetical protein|nr:hypothetical protein [Pseudomonadota bacterium]